MKGIIAWLAIKQKQKILLWDFDVLMTMYHWETFHDDLFSTVTQICSSKQVFIRRKVEIEMKNEAILTPIIQNSSFQESIFSKSMLSDTLIT